MKQLMAAPAAIKRRTVETDERAGEVFKVINNYPDSALTGCTLWQPGTHNKFNSYFSGKDETNPLPANEHN
jgi:hypothetical protein